MKIKLVSLASRVLATTAISALALAGAQVAVAAPAYDSGIPGLALDIHGLTSEQIFFNADWNLPDADLWMARNYIAEHDGKSAVGLVARAWVADRAGRSDEALSMYRQCLADERTAAYCAYRMLLPGTREKISAADFERISSLVDNQKFGALHDPTGLLNYMFLYRAKVLNDEPGAYKFLERWEKNYPQYSASYLVIRGDYESNFKNDYVASLKSYLAAEKIDPANSEIQLRIIDLVFDHFPSLTSANEGNAANNAPFLKGDKAVVAFAQCAKYVAANRSTNPIAASSLLIHTADRLRQDLQLVTISSNIDQFDRLETFEFARAKFRDGGLPVESLYTYAYKLHPTGEAVAGQATTIAQAASSSYQPDDEEGFDRSRGSGIDRVTIELLTKANDELPNNPKILKLLGIVLGRYDRNQADAFFKQALQLPMPATLRKEIVEDYASTVHERWNDYDAAIALYRANVDLDRTAMLTDKFMAEEYKGDLNTASRTLDELYAHLKAQPTGANEPWFDKQRHFIGRWTQNETSRAAVLEQSAVPLKPILATDGVLAVSSDGKVAVIGSQPMQLINLTTGARIRELGRGGSDSSFSPDGHYLAAASNFTEGDDTDTHQFLVYDVATRSTIVNLVRSDKVNAVAWDPKGGRVAFVTDFTVNIYDLTRHSLKSRPLPTATNGWKLTWLPKINQLAVGLLWGSEIELFDPDTLNLTHGLKGPHFTHAIASTGDGRYLVAIDNERKIYTWNAQNLDAPPHVDSAPFVGRLTSRPNSSHVLISGMFNQKIAIYDAATNTSIAQDAPDQKGAAQFSHDGMLLYRARGAAIELRDPATLKVLKTLQLGGNKLENIAFDGPLERLLIDDSDGVAVWDLSRRSMLKLLPGLHLVDSSRIDQGKVLLRRGPADTARDYLWFDTRALTLRSLLTVDNQIKVTASAVRGDVLVLAGVTPGEPETQASTSSGRIETYDLRSGQRLASVSDLVIPTAYGQFDFITDPKIESVDVSDDGVSAAYTTSWVNGRSTGQITGDAVRIVSLADGKETKRLSFSSPAHSVKFSLGGRVQVVLDYRQVTRDIASDTQISSDDRYGNAKQVIELPKSGGSLVYQYDQLARIDAGGHRTERWFEDNLSFVAADDAHGRLIAVTRQGSVELLDISTLKPMNSASR